MAIVFPALLLLIMLTVQYGLWFHAREVTYAAAAEALDAAQTPTGTAEDGQRAALSFLGTAGNLQNVEVHVHRGSEQVEVRIEGTAPRLVPGFEWSVVSIAQGSVERFIPEPDR